MIPTGQRPPSAPHFRVYSEATSSAMLRRFFAFLYGDVAVSFRSDFPMSESVVRLRGGTGRSIFSSLLREAVVGRVSESRVRLQRVQPFFSNGFKPIFAGAFRRHQGRVVLAGRFTMLLFSKVFITVWLTFALVWTAMAAWAALNAAGDRPPKSGPEAAVLLVPLIGVAFCLGGIAFARCCWWLSRNDINVISAVIQQALSREASPPALERRR